MLGEVSQHVLGVEEANLKTDRSIWANELTEPVTSITQTFLFEIMGEGTVDGIKAFHCKDFG